jgi:hypothetical protein
MKSTNAKLADKVFAEDRRKYFGGNGVKDHLRRAIEQTKESLSICSTPNGSDPNSEGSKAIARLVVELEGRLKAFEAVWDAMHGNKAMLRYYGTT